MYQLCPLTSSENLTNPRNNFFQLSFRHLLQLNVAVNDGQNIHELTLVLVKAFALNVKERIRGNIDTEVQSYIARQFGLS